MAYYREQLELLKDLKLLSPIKNPRITQLFGENPDYYARWGYLGHNGEDYGHACGTNIRLAYDGGLDVKGQEKNGYGNYLRFLHLYNNIEFYTYYCHLSVFSVFTFINYNVGEVIGLVGTTGASTGCHLHFGLRLKNYSKDDPYKGYIDPRPFITDNNDTDNSFPMCGITNNKVNFRTEPDYEKQDNLIAMLYPGKNIDVLDKTGNWYKVKVHNLPDEGFIHQDYIDFCGEN